MASFLQLWLQRIHPDLPVQCVPHEGKKDLRRSVPRKLRAWREPGVRFVVVIDNDGGDCLALKDELVGLCQEAGRADTLVRIACQELEAWYLGDPEAVVAAYREPALRAALGRTRFRDPDGIHKPSEALARLLPQFQKVSGAKVMAAHIDRARNRSTSFAAFASGIDRLTGDWLLQAAEEG